MRPRPFRHKIAHSFMLVGLTVLASGCVKSSTVIAVNDDGSGTAEVVLAVDPAAVSELSAGGPPGLAVPAEPAEGEVAPSTVPPDQICDQAAALALPATLPPDATTEPYADGEFCGQRIGFPFTSEDDLQAALDTVLGADTSGTELILQPEGDGWRFEAPVISLEQTGLIDNAGIPPQVAQAVIADAQVVYQITLPGTATDGGNNADMVDGGTFIWNVDLASPRQMLVATTGPAATSSADSATPIVAGLAIAGLTALILGVIMTRRRSRHRASAMGPDLDYDNDVYDSDGYDNGYGGDGSYDDGYAGQTWADAPSYDHRPQSGRARSATPDNPIVSEPWWDEELGLWLAEHPLDGIVAYDERSETWVPT